MEGKVGRTQTLFAPSSIMSSWLEQPIGATQSTMMQGTPNQQVLVFYQPNS